MIQTNRIKKWITNKLSEFHVLDSKNECQLVTSRLRSQTAHTEWQNEKRSKKKHEWENATHDHFARLECRGVDTASCRANHVLVLRVEKSYSLWPHLLPLPFVTCNRISTRLAVYVCARPLRSAATLERDGMLTKQCARVCANIMIQSAFAGCWRKLFRCTGEPKESHPGDRY